MSLYLGACHSPFKAAMCKIEPLPVRRRETFRFKKKWNDNVLSIRNCVTQDGVARSRGWNECEGLRSVDRESIVNNEERTGSPKTLNQL